MKVYIASSLERRSTVRRLKSMLTAVGIEPICDWAETTHGGVNDLTSDERLKWALKDVEQVKEADVLVLIPPPETRRGGCHTEFGLALGLSKRLIIVGPPLNIFHFLPECESVPTIQAVVDTLLGRTA